VKIYASSDHAGHRLRGILIAYLRQKGVTVEDLGPASAEPLDYPDQAAVLGHKIRDEAGARGLLICGSGIGVCMVANKIRGVRAVAAWNAESAQLSRAHNDSNVLCLGERLVSEVEAIPILDAWLETPFEGGRHARRVAKMAEIESREAAETTGKIG
jgi:ribose 5-phosphate isomerase B